jgi:hypothetical protein
VTEGINSLHIRGVGSNGHMMELNGGGKFRWSSCAMHHFIYTFFFLLSFQWGMKISNWIFLWWENFRFLILKMAWQFLKVGYWRACKCENMSSIHR